MLFIIDANVLIDYANTDPSILSLAIKHIGPIFVASVILDEVEQLSVEDCVNLGLRIIEEPVEILIAAGERRGRLSFEDHICLLLAVDNEYICISNDKPLHSACREENVSVMWGLRLMIELVRKGVLDKSSAMEVAEAIHLSNPFHITSEIIAEFKNKLYFSHRA